MLPEYIFDNWDCIFFFKLIYYITVLYLNREVHSKSKEKTASDPTLHLNTFDT